MSMSTRKRGGIHKSRAQAKTDHILGLIDDLYLDETLSPQVAVQQLAKINSHVAQIVSLVVTLTMPRKKGSHAKAKAVNNAAS